jgi:hypothetical protein
MLSEKKMNVWQVPLDAYPRIEQGGMILKSVENTLPFSRFRKQKSERRIERKAQHTRRSMKD